MVEKSWSNHPLAGGDIMLRHILPLVTEEGPLTAARAKAVCPAWNALLLELGTVYEHPLEELPPQKDCDDSFAWAPDGRSLVATLSNPFRLVRYSDRGAKLWEVLTPELPAFLIAHPVEWFHEPSFFSRDGSRLVTIWNDPAVETHYTLFYVSNGRVVVTVPCSQDGHDRKSRADFGVPGSASDGLLGIASAEKFSVELFRAQELLTQVHSQMGIIGPDAVWCGELHL